ncbi:hypothetical protein HanIR_Chr06g0274221 [Helianthus annuus]|nr:hypothetical protein HanIR_Chr06g0274221 [Helianthus annuus]
MYLMGIMEVTAASERRIADISSHDGHVGFDVMKPYIEMSSDDWRAALISSEWYVHDDGTGGCMTIKRTPVAITSTKLLLADCILKKKKKD